MTEFERGLRCVLDPKSAPHAGAMSEFERGVRYAAENTEAYVKGSGPAVTQFGDYQMSVIPKGALEPSAHRERRIAAILSCAAETTQ